MAENLTERMDSMHPNGWSTEGTPREAVTRRYNAIRGFRLYVTRMQAKCKLGQDEPLRHAVAAPHALKARAQGRDLELAAMIRKQNEARGEPALLARAAATTAALSCTI